MKNHFAVTISDVSGSRHYRVKKTAKRYLLVAFLLAVSSFCYNYWQHQYTGMLSDRNARLDRQLTDIGHHNARLGEALARHNREVQALNRELGEIERSSGLGVAVGDDRTALAQRLGAIGQFYNGKKTEYTEISGRVARIEAQIAGITTPPAGPSQVAWDADHLLAERVDQAALSVHQEVVLHSSIPNGFPTESRTITSNFGQRIHPVTKRNSFHKGVDIRAKGHAPIRATADGVVRAANYSKLSGNRVIVRHNFGFESFYAHLHKMHVKPGDVVQKGDVVGVSGNSGQSAAPHLHYEIHYLEKPVDPIDFLQWEFGSHEIFTQVKSIKWPSLINLINKQITHPTLQLSQLEPVLPERPR